MTSTEITKILGRQILDSRGAPTIEVEVITAGGVRATASVSSGSSRGTSEVHELRDGIPHLYDGCGVAQAIAGINTTISDLLHGWDACAGVEMKITKTPRNTACQGAPAAVG
jgi:enolase